MIIRKDHKEDYCEILPILSQIKVFLASQKRVKENQECVTWDYVWDQYL